MILHLKQVFHLCKLHGPEHITAVAQLLQPAPDVDYEKQWPATQQQPLGFASPGIEIATSPNPMGNSNTLRYHVAVPSQVTIMLYDASGKPVKVLVNKKVQAGTYTTQWNANGMAKGSYFISGSKDNGSKQTVTVVKE